jgi:hypothetical protein
MLQCLPILAFRPPLPGTVTPCVEQPTLCGIWVPTDDVQWSWSGEVVAGRCMGW